MKLQLKISAIWNHYLQKHHLYAPHPKEFKFSLISEMLNGFLHAKLSSTNSKLSKCLNVFLYFLILTGTFLNKLLKTTETIIETSECVIL